MIKLKELVDLPLFSDLTVITNPHTLDNIVETIDITETPDVADFTTSKALLLTTAMAFKDKPEELIGFIKSLIRIEVAGLAIKVNRFIHYIPQDVVDFCNDNNFALIEIPADLTLGILSHNMLDYILGKQTQQMLYALNIQKHYSKLVIDGASPQQILDELSLTIKTPIILITPFMRSIANSTFFNETFNPANFYIDQIVNSIDHTVDKVTTQTILNPKEQAINVNIHPVKVNSSFPYYLIIFEPNKLTYPIAHFAIDQGIMVLSFIIYKNNQIENSMIGVQSSFFNKILFGNHPVDRNDREFFDQGLNYGLISTNFYQAIICDVQVRTEIPMMEEATGNIIYQWLTESIIPKIKYGLVFYNKKTKVTNILLQHRIENLESILHTSAQELEQLLDIKVHFGIGKSVGHPYEIRNSYFEAIKALEETTDTYVKHYLPSGLMTLFNEENEEAIIYFIKQQLKDLAFSEDPFAVELTTTLKAFLDNQSEISKTADDLYLHRNTITYRIKKCEELLGIDLKDPTVSLNLRIALELMEIR